MGFTRETIWALSDRGVIESVVDYKVNSREGRDAIRLVAEQLGLRERLPTTPKGHRILCAYRARDSSPCGAWSPWCIDSWACIDHGAGDSANLLATGTAGARYQTGAIKGGSPPTY